MKKQYGILHFVAIFIVTLGIRLLTDSWMMTLGIVMILLLIDRLLINYDNRNRNK